MTDVRKDPKIDFQGRRIYPSDYIKWGLIGVTGAERIYPYSRRKKGGAI